MVVVMGIVKLAVGKRAGGNDGGGSNVMGGVVATL